MGVFSEQEGSSAHSNRRQCAVVRNVFAVFQLTRFIRDLFCQPTVTGDESGGPGHQRRSPAKILNPKARGLGKELFLIRNEMLQEWNAQFVFRIFSRLQLILLFM